MNWTNLTMALKVRTNKVTIRRDPSLTKVEVLLKMLTKLWSKRDQGFLFELQVLSMEEQGQKRKSNDSCPMRYKNFRNNLHVFQLPTRLPPKRNADHQIVLVEGQQPVNV